MKAPCSGGCFCNSFPIPRRSFSQLLHPHRRKIMLLILRDFKTIQSWRTTMSTSIRCCPKQAMSTFRYTFRLSANNDESIYQMLSEMSDEQMSLYISPLREQNDGYIYQMLSEISAEQMSLYILPLKDLW
ncbi:hypothetical protein BJ508DRAFT_54532 [Ascobolus immersus RN42]|uniref:Uncharacterized protein n=1 Tax=Ascobolus immersus RN42 TaxID=1160509 RepID=A0A3N4HKU3_ASCIM|nr:hypothetical protein BJ508DRAFT_54532 [Ascobolus immersus RN42]